MATGKQILAKAMAGGRFRRPISEQANVRGNDVAQVRNFLTLSRRLRTLRLKSEAATARFRRDVADIRKEVDRDALTEKGFQEQTERFRQRALVDATSIRDQAEGLAQTAERAFTTYLDPHAYLSRQSLAGRKGHDGKADLAAYLDRLPEHQRDAEIQRMIDDRDLGALGVAMNVDPDLVADVLTVIRPELHEVTEAEATVASALIDDAEIRDLTERLQSGNAEERKALKIWARQQDILGGRFKHVPQGELEKAGIPDDTRELAEQNRARAEIEAAEAVADEAREPSGKELLAAAMKPEGERKRVGRVVTTEDFVQAHETEKNRAAAAAQDN